MTTADTSRIMSLAAKDAKSQQQVLHSKYPISSTWEFTLGNDEKVKGEIYCTDPIAELVVLQDQLNDIRIVSVANIRDSKQLNEASKEQLEVAASNMAHTKKALEEREKRAIRLAQESLRHLNPNVSGIFAVGANHEKIS